MSHGSALLIMAGVVALSSYAIAGDANMTTTHVKMAQEHHMVSHCMAHRQAQGGRESRRHMKMACRRRMKMQERDVRISRKTEMRDGQSTNPPR